jgi:hypothetical protein
LNQHAAKFRESVFLNRRPPLIAVSFRPEFGQLLGCVFLKGIDEGQPLPLRRKQRRSSGPARLYWINAVAYRFFGLCGLLTRSRKADFWECPKTNFAPLVANPYAQQPRLRPTV